jgi:hypothetical protein
MYKCSSSKKQVQREKTLQQLGEWLQKKVIGPFVYVFLILAMEVS